MRNVIGFDTGASLSCVWSVPKSNPITLRIFFQNLVLKSSERDWTWYIVILPIIERARSLSLHHDEKMIPTQRGSWFNQAVPKKLLPNKKKKKEDNAVPVWSHRAQRRRQGNQAHQNIGILVKTTRDISEGGEEGVEAKEIFQRKGMKGRKPGKCVRGRGGKIVCEISCCVRKWGK